ncbi:hypothetical protein Ahia01_000657100 [Argonauta hians]
MSHHQHHCDHQHHHHHDHDHCDHHHDHRDQHYHHHDQHDQHHHPQLSYEARELACHFADAYHKRLEENLPSLRRHWYRAALQCVVKAIEPNFKHGCIKIAFKNVEKLSFDVYLEKALKSLGFSVSQAPADVIEHCKSTEDQWKLIVCFYTFRLSLAPVVETLILLDRMLYILESGIPCALVPIFEPQLSPRNFILLAAKPTYQHH